MTAIFGQDAFGVRFDWGPTGSDQLHADVAVVVDVLSFSTSVAVAVSRGMRVFPYRWKDTPRAAAFAAAHDAVLAVGRLESASMGAGAAPSLSPSGLLTCRRHARIVLPSPNGSTIAARLADAGSEVVVGCLRNAGAVAQRLAQALESNRSVAVIAAGERWESDDSLRPALEDQLGAGAILAELRRLGFSDSMSPESDAAAGVFESQRDRLRTVLRGCVGGRELVARGFGADVDVAAALDVTSVVPLLRDGAFDAA